PRARGAGVAAHQRRGRLRHEHRGAHAHAASSRLAGGVARGFGASRRHQPRGDDGGGGGAHLSPLYPSVPERRAHARIPASRDLRAGSVAALGVRRGARGPRAHPVPGARAQRGGPRLHLDRQGRRAVEAASAHAPAALRGAHAEHGAMLQTVTLRPNEVDVQPVLRLPSVRFLHSGVFMGSPDWGRRFEYLEDRRRYEDFQEDMWSPGILEVELFPGRTEDLLLAVGELPDRTPAEHVMDAAAHVLAQVPGQEWEPMARALSVAADQFVLEPEGAIVAGYPWLDVWARDVALALPGIHLARGRLEQARSCLRYLCGQLVGGLLPNRLSYGPTTTALRPPVPADPEPALDATLWLFEAARHWAIQAGPGDPFVREEVFPALREVYEVLTG